MDVPSDSGLSDNTAKLLFAAVVALAGIVGYLFRLMMRRDANKDKRIAQGDQIVADERAAARVRDQQWESRVDKLRLEFEQKHRELAEKYAQDLRDVYESSREHEDTVRGEFAQVMENVSAKAGESSAAIVDVLDRFYSRFVGPRPRDPRDGGGRNR